jgi:Putative adhesin
MTFLSDTGGSGSTTGSWRPSAPLRMTSARWAVLALAVPVALALIGWTGFGIVALLAKGSYPFSFPVPVHNGQVNANLNVGNITLRQVPGGTARVTGTVQYGLFRPGITSSATPGGDSVGVNCDGINDNCNVNATLDVPARTPVTLSSDGGDIAVSGLASDLTLSADGGNLTASNLTGHQLLLDTGGGDLTASGLRGTIRIGTEGGNINSGDLVGPMRIDTSGGDLNGNGFTGDLTVSTGGGNVDANGVTSSHVYVQSGGGDVTLVFTQPPQDLQIAAVGGNVNVILPSGDTRYNISANAQGGNLNIPSTLTSSTSHDTITINSGGGDITISQAG